MRCADVVVELPAFVAREPSDAAGAEIEEHLAACAECNKEAGAVRDTIALASVAALERDPRVELEAEIFGFLDLEPVARLVSEAPLTHEPPLPLEQQALAHAGIAPSGRSTWQGAARIALPALAASLAVLGFLGAQWRSDAVDATAEADRVQARMGPWGKGMQTFPLVVHGASGTPAPQVTANLRRIDADMYTLHLRIEDYWPTDRGRVCQVWLIGPQDPAPVGSFVITEAEQVKIANWTMAIDPEDYSHVRITLEEDNDGALEGPTLMEAPLDL